MRFALLFSLLALTGCTGTRVKAGVCFYDEAGRGYCGEVEFDRPAPLPPLPPNVPTPPPQIVLKPEDAK